MREISGILGGSARGGASRRTTGRRSTASTGRRRCRRPELLLMPSRLRL